MSPLFFDTVFAYSRSIIPWLFLGIILAYYAEKHLGPELIKKYIGVFSFRKAMSAIFLGMISPLSIMSFLPVAREFVDLGAHSGMLFIFLIAERAYDLQSFFIISSLFGLKFAFFNALAIFISLFVTALALKREHITFQLQKKRQHTFWYQQVRLLCIVIVGILISSLVRVNIPQQLFEGYTGNTIGGLFGGILAGFLIYLGPIIANYPIAKAFLDLGMTHMGVFAFLTISPIINFVIFLLFGGVVGYQTTIKAFLIYGVTSLFLTLLFSLLL